MISEKDPASELIAGAVDRQRGLVQRRIFSDAAIYEAEQDRVFRRSWLFLAHETQIPNPGDYVTTRMGETPVIVVRDNDMIIRGLINSCRHRGSTVTRTDAGCARTFTCPYHGWTYDLQGKRVQPGSLVGLPGQTGYYKDKLDITSWGLLPVAKVESFHGLVFGNLDPEAPLLAEYLGDFRWFLDLVLDRGDFAAVPGVMRWRMKCNWKFATDNGAGDNAHVAITHRSAIHAMQEASGERGASPVRLGEQYPGFTLLTEYGHSVNCATLTDPSASAAEAGPPRKPPPNRIFDHWRTNPEVVEKLGHFRTGVWRYNGNVFPNLFVIDNLLMLRNPIGPSETEIRAIALYDRNAPPELQDLQRRRAFLKFGPTGLFEQDDGENWDQSTAGSAIREALDADLNYEMGIGTGRFVSDDKSPPRINSMVNEHGQMWFYGFWSDAMAASDWSDLKAHHALPVGTI